MKIDSVRKVDAHVQTEICVRCAYYVCFEFATQFHRILMLFTLSKRENITNRDSQNKIK